MILVKNRNNLMTLDGKSIARCLKPENLVILSIVLYNISQVHVKVDMVSLAIRLLKERGQVHCTLQIGRSTVVP